VRPFQKLLEYEGSAKKNGNLTGATLDDKGEHESREHDTGIEDDNRNHAKKEENKFYPR
jgi:hypothetical protein